jgi:hypothetical protein
MAYSQTEPVVEASSKITFIHNTFGYEGMFEHMKKNKLSIWNNKFTQIFDFSKGDTPNFTIDLNRDRCQNFVYDFEVMKEAAQAYQKDSNMIESYAAFMEDDQVREILVNN